jgi:protein-tyrosine phosphatase
MALGLENWPWLHARGAATGLRTKSQTGSARKLTPFSLSLSLLTVEEEQELDVGNEATQAKAHGVEFLSFPIADRQVPSSEDNLTRLLEQVDRKLSSGKSVLMHCREGIGRVGLVAACLLLTKGLNAEMALNRLAVARGVPLPETPGAASMDRSLRGHACHC